MAVLNLQIGHPTQCLLKFLVGTVEEKNIKEGLPGTLVLKCFTSSAWWSLAKGFASERAYWDTNPKNL